MNAFVEQNKRLLRVCCTTARIYGWLLLSFGLLATAGHSFALMSRIGKWDLFYDYLESVPWNVIGGVASGVLALGIGQFISFVIDNDCRRGWILRNASRLLYVYAVFVGAFIVILSVMAFPNWENWNEIIIRLLGRMVHGAGKILLLIGIALILKRIMSVIEESRTLV